MAEGRQFAGVPRETVRILTLMIMKMLKIKGEPQQVKFFRQLQFPECHLWRFCCGQCHSKNGED